MININTSNGPKVSVILAVYNGENYIKDAINSILNQTYSNFELIIIDDGSSDSTATIVKSFTDSRIRFIEQENTGLAATLNRAINLSNGKYIARQDHDDLSFPLRLEKQVDFLETNPEYAILGTNSIIWEKDTPTNRGHRHPTDFATLNFKLLFDCFFVHSSVMLRKEALDQIGLYTTDPNRQPPEDFELWSRIVRQYKAANLNETLLVYRELPSSITRTVNFKEKLIQICSENLAFMAQLDHPDNTTWNISTLYHNEPNLIREPFEFSKVKKLLLQIASNVDTLTPGGNAVELANQLLQQFNGRIPMQPSSTGAKKSNLNLILRAKNKIKYYLRLLLK